MTTDATITARGRAAITGDVWGGLAAMLVALPSAIAFGVVIYGAASPDFTSAGAMAGMIGAAILGILAPLVSRNGGFITAPCAPAAAVLSGLAASMAKQSTSADRILVAIALTAFMAALLQMIYGALRAGRLIKFIPYQVVSGYLSGVAVIIAVAQVPKFLGMTGGHHVRWQAVVVGSVTVLAMALAPRITKAVPGTIIGLVAGVATYFAIAFFRPELLVLEHNSLIIGPIRSTAGVLQIATQRFTSLFALHRADLALAIGPALTLSVLLSIDTLKTGVVLDTMLRRRHQSNRELIGQGVANFASFLGGGVPGAGAMGPTLVNVSSGGRTWLSGTIEGVLVVAAIVVLGTAIAWVPIATLAGILLVIAFRMFDFKMFRLLLLPSARLDFFVIAAVIIVAESVGLIQASAVGIGLAILLFIRNQIRTSVILRKSDLREVRSKLRRTPAEAKLLEEHGGDALLLQLKDDLFFGTTDQLFSDLEDDLRKRRFILLDFRRVQSMDFTAVRLLGQMQARLRERGGELLFSGMPSSLPSRQDIANYMAQLGLFGTESGIRVFETRDSALEWIEDEILAAAGFYRGESKPPLLLTDFDVFHDMDTEMTRILSAWMREVNLAPGEKLFRAGDAGDEIFFVRKGRIHILLPLESGKRHHLATISRGDFFGEMGFLDRHVRSADAEAGTNSFLFSLSREHFNQCAQGIPDLTTRVFERLALAIAQRLRATDAEVRALEER